MVVAGQMTIEELEQWLGAIPEERRPRIVSVPETPATNVANLSPDIDFAQPLRPIDSGTIEVLFEEIPTQDVVNSVAQRIGQRVRVAITHPGKPDVFSETRKRAIAMRGEVTEWIQGVLEVAARVDASDLRLGAGDLPLVKVGGVGWRRLTEFPVALPEQVEQAAFWAAGKELDPTDPLQMDVDAAVTFQSRIGRHRLRANIYRERGNWALALRFIPEHPLPLDQLGLPEIVESFADLERGLVLVTGVTGSGKSTTLAGIIDKINGRDSKVIQTIEHPIEFVHQPRMSSIHQREVGTDTESFAVALRSAMRQNPDIVLVGEIRDYEEIATAVTLAETGHLVFATLHTNSAAETITRLTDVFPVERQDQIRIQLSMALAGVVCQHLFERIDEPGKGVVATEVLVVNDSIATLIKKGDVGKIPGYILDGKREGMVHMDRSLAQLVAEGKIADATARHWVNRTAYYEECLNEFRGGRW